MQLKALREAASFTQEELATIAGLSVHAVSALERGERRRPHVDTVRALCALPGIGPWTANYVAMRACGERDAFPASDLALRRVLGPDPAEAAEPWRPWRAYGAMHVWQSPHIAGAEEPVARHFERLGNGRHDAVRVAQLI